MCNFRWYVEESGNLIIRDVSSEDDGSYACVATNLAGVRKSKPISLAAQSEFEIVFEEILNLNFNILIRV